MTDHPWSSVGWLMGGTQLSGGEKTKCLKIQVQSQEGRECQEMDRGAEGTDFRGPSYRQDPPRFYWPLGVQLLCIGSFVHSTNAWGHQVFPGAVLALPGLFF